MIANIVSATVPMTVTRSASCGVIGGRRSSGGWITASSWESDRAAATAAAAG